MKTLEPLTLKDRYYLPIELTIRRMLDDIIYRPLLAVIDMNVSAVKRKFNLEIKNSDTTLRYAVATGVIWYEDGQFKGTFNARTSASLLKLGAKFNRKSRTYSLPAAQVPIDLKIAQEQANMRYETMRVQMLSVLDNIHIDQLQLGAAIKDEYEHTLSRMDADLRRTLPKEAGPDVDNPASARSRIVVEAVLTDAQRRIIAEDWSNNLELYIKGWAQDNILKLREQIQPHVLAGGRAEGLVKVLQDNYGIGARKAKFLARQETSLLMSKFQETRYRDIGIEKYRWSTAHDARVRHDHHDLNGKVFRFDSPPVTDKKTGARNNPGEDFNCRCVAIPLVE